MLHFGLELTALSVAGSCSRGATQAHTGRRRPSTTPAVRSREDRPAHQNLARQATAASVRSAHTQRGVRRRAVGAGVRSGSTDEGGWPPWRGGHGGQERVPAGPHAEGPCIGPSTTCARRRSTSWTERLPNAASRTSSPPPWDGPRERSGSRPSGIPAGSSPSSTTLTWQRSRRSRKGPLRRRSSSAHRVATSDC